MFVSKTVLFFGADIMSVFLQEALLSKYLSSKNIEEAVHAVKEMKAPKHFLPEMLRKIVVCSLEHPDEDQEQASVLIHALCTDGLVTGENLIQVGFTTSKNRLLL